MSDMYIDRDDLVNFLLSAIQGSDYASKEMKDMATSIADKASQELETMPPETKQEIYKVFEETSAGPPVQDILKGAFDKAKEFGGKALQTGQNAISRVDEYADSLSGMMDLIGGKREQQEKTKPMSGMQGLQDPKRFSDRAVNIPEMQKTERREIGYSQRPKWYQQQMMTEQQRLEEEKKRQQEETMQKLSRGDLQDLLGRF